MKSPKSTKMWHTPKAKIGMGDNYGSGVKNKVGRIKDISVGMGAISPKKLMKPPKTLA